MSRVITVLVCGFLIALVSCKEEKSSSGGAIGTVNPASAYCIESGGTLKIVKEAGGDVGYCHLPDGRVVEEWLFFRGHGQPPRK